MWRYAANKISHTRIDFPYGDRAEDHFRGDHAKFSSVGKAVARPEAQHLLRQEPDSRLFYNHRLL